MSASTQPLQALALANETRIAGMRFCTKVGSYPAAKGRLTLAKTLEHNGFAPGVGALRLHRFLTSARRIGPDLALQICREASMCRHDPRVRDLTLRERAALAGVLRRLAAGGKSS